MWWLRIIRYKHGNIYTTWIVFFSHLPEDYLIMMYHHDTVTKYKQLYTLGWYDGFDGCDVIWSCLKQECRFEFIFKSFFSAAECVICPLVSHPIRFWFDLIRGCHTAYCDKYVERRISHLFIGTLIRLFIW